MEQELTLERAMVLWTAMAGNPKCITERFSDTKMLILGQVNMLLVRERVKPSDIHWLRLGIGPMPPRNMVEVACDAETYAKALEIWTAHKELPLDGHTLEEIEDMVLNHGKK